MTLLIVSVVVVADTHGQTDTQVAMALDLPTAIV